MEDGKFMYELAQQLFPINRSLTGQGVRKTLHILQELVPRLQIYEVPTGTKAFDWTVPNEWNIRDGFIADEAGNRVISFKENNLHIVGYSVPVDRVVELEELKRHIYVQEDAEDWIPYVTSYYKERFGFCMSKKQREELTPGKYRMYIDSTLKPGSLTYGELVIPATQLGQGKDELLISTYICHPSMANNELSGPCVAAALARWVEAQPKRRFTYRFIFVPETLGSLVYLNKRAGHLKKHLYAGFNLSCVGDDRTYSYVETRYADTVADRVLANILPYHTASYTAYSFLERGSDERQYNAPGIDLPVCTVCRSKFGEYPEYHTSADDLSLISPQGLEGSLQLMKKCLEGLESNLYYRATCLGEPQLGKRGLYPTESYKGSANGVRRMMDLLAYADGRNDLIEIGSRIGAPVNELRPIAERLEEAGLLEGKSERMEARG